MISPYHWCVLSEERWVEKQEDGIIGTSKQDNKQLRLLYLKNPTMAAATLHLAKPCCTPKIPFPSHSRVSTSVCRIRTPKPQAGVSHFLSIVEPASSFLQLQLHEPSNALSLPTWAVHVSSVVEWWPLHFTFSIKYLIIRLVSILVAHTLFNLHCLFSVEKDYSHGFGVAIRGEIGIWSLEGAFLGYGESFYFICLLFFN